MKLITKTAYLFVFVTFSALIACGDSSSTSADNVESSSSEPEKVIESSSSESSSSSLSSSSESSSSSLSSSSSSSEDEEEPVIKENHPWPSDSLIAILRGDYVPALIADNSVDFFFERHKGDFQYAVSTDYMEAQEFGYMDSLKAANFEATADSNYYGAYLGKYVDHKIIIATYGFREILFKYYDVSAVEFPAEAFSARNRGVELPKIEVADGFYFDSLNNILVIAGTEENFDVAYRESLGAIGYKAENDSILEKMDIQNKYVLSVNIHKLGVGRAYEIKLKYKDLSNYAYYRMPDNFKVTYYEQSPGYYVQQNTLYRDAKDYYYTSSLKYTSTISFESNYSYRFKYDEVSGFWLKYENRNLKDSLSELEFIEDIVDYAGLAGSWNIFDTDVEDYLDQGVVNYKVTTNISGLECRKWTTEKYAEMIEKTICSAEGNDYLLSQKKGSSSKNIGISEFEIGGVVVPAE